MTSVRPALCVLLLLCLSASLGAQDSDAIRAKLDIAKKTFEVEVEKQQKELLELLSKREEQARNDGNRRLVDLVLAERAEFETKGRLPRSVSLANYLFKIGAAKKVLATAYDEAIRLHVRAKNDKGAAAIEAEKKEILKGLSSGVDTKVELARYMEGTEWAWSDKASLFLQPDGVAVQPEWIKSGLATKWTAIDRRTIVLTVVKGRNNDKICVLTFNEELTEMDGIGFEGAEFTSTIKRRK
jgi:hypothetical protein